MPLLGSRGAASLTGFGGLANLGYFLRNSLRFRASNSAYLSRTGTTASNVKTATYSFWMKRGILSTGTQWIFTGGGSGAVSLIGFNAGADTLSVFNSDTSAEGNITTAVFRDPAAWYHIVIRINTTEGSAADRAKIYVNGVQQAVSVNNSGIGPDATWNFNTAQTLNIGRYTGASGYSDLYLAEIHFIDGGTPPLPSAFAKTDPVTGQWIPIKYTGTYGNNGFYLKFNDTSNTTAATLGKDSSGNGNNWTPNGFSITAGATYDPVTDVPTLTSATAANYAVLNPLANPVGTLVNGNLQISTTTDSKVTTATMALPSTGQYYFEITATDYATGGGVSLGLVNSPFLTTSPANGTWIGIGTYSGSYSNGTSTDTNGLTGTDVTNDGDIWCIAIDVTNNKFWAGRSRSGTLVWADGVTPAVNGSGASTLSLPTGDLYPMIYRGGSLNEIYNFNFGQQPFAHTPPSGFKALNTFNLP